MKKLTAAWEKKNSKTARAGGASLMALSLAACGGEDNTPFSAADVSAAEAAATTAALTGADGTVYASVDAAVTSNDTAIADAARAEGVASVDITTDNQAAIDAAVAAVDLTTDNAAAIDAAVAADTAFASLSDLVAAYDALATPSGSSFAATTTASETINGTAGNDTFTAATTTYQSGDVYMGGEGTDTFTLTSTGDVSATPTVVGFETININIEAFGAAGGDGATTVDVDMANITGGTVNLDVTQAGSSLALAAFDNVKSNSVMHLSDDFTAVVVTSVDNASYTVNADGNIGVTDAGATADDVTIIGAGTVTVGTAGAYAADGDLTITAADDITVTEADTAATLTATTTGGKITVTTADAATAITLTASEDVDIVGATAATTATLSAAGTNDDTTATESTIVGTALTTVNVSGNGGAAEFNLRGSASVSTLNISGDQNVIVTVDGADIDALASGITVTDTSTGTSMLEFATSAGGDSYDLDAASVDKINLAADMNADTLTLASGAYVSIAEDQTALTLTASVNTAATNTVSVEVATETGATSHAVTSLTASNMSVVNLILSDTAAATGGIDVTTIDAGTATLNISGAGALDANSITAGSVNAADATGDLDIVLAGTATVGTVTTGAGDDTITQTADLTTGGYTVNTGAGTDTITVLAAADSTVDGGTGTDTVNMNGDYTARTMSFSNVEVLNVETGSNVNSSLVSGATYVVTDNDASTLTVTADAAVVDLSGLVVDATNMAITVDASGWTAVAAATVTGSADADVINITGGKGSTADGGAGADTITGGAAADVIIGGAGGDTLLSGEGGADTITAGEGADSVNGGTGADVIDLTEATAAIDTVVIDSGDTTSTVYDSITGFATSATKGDILDITDTTVEGAASGTDVSAATTLTTDSITASISATGIITLSGTDSANVDTLTEWISVAQTMATTETIANNTTEYATVAFEFGGNTYVLQEKTVDTAGTEVTTVDTFVELVGLTDVTGLSTTAAANVIDIA